MRGEKERKGDRKKKKGASIERERARILKGCCVLRLTIVLICRTRMREGEREREREKERERERGREERK